MWDEGISDARHGRSPIPVTHFPDSKSADAYSRAYARQVGFMRGGKKKKFFGDPDWWMNRTKEWKEILQTNSDPLTRPGNQAPHGSWWGGGYR